MWIVDVQKDDNFPRNKAAQDIGVRGAFGLPIKISTETVAVLEFFTSEALEADPDILDVMRMVGFQVGRVLERERARTSLIQQAEELSRSNEELDAFSYSVSHDLRAPLRAIDGFSGILLKEHSTALSEEALRYLQLVRDNAQNMGTLITDLLSFSQLGRQPLRKEQVKPSSLVSQALVDLASERQGRHVEVSVGDQPCYADPALLKQVFVNLIGNALKYTRKVDDAIINVGCLDGTTEPGERVYFVKDNGAGFDMEYADKLFGVFQRLHRVEDFEGTGVGLATVQRIIHRHGGRVWAEAEVDNGATFFFTLAQGGPSLMSPGVESLVEILLVEDNPTDVELTLHALRSNNLGNPVHVVRDGAEALDFIFGTGEYSGRSVENGPKVILLDLMLPKIDGLEVLRRIKADPRTKAIPVVMLTSSREERDVVESYQSGVNSYIVKPVDFEQLAEAVRQLGLYWLILNEPPVLSQPSQHSVKPGPAT